MAQSEGFTPTGEFLIEECTMKAPLATMHYHNSYELYYVLKGERDYFIENQFFKASNNNVVLVPKGLPHRTAGKGATRILVNFTDEFLLRYFSKKVIDNILSDFKPIVLTPSKEENDRLQALFKKMISEYDRIGKKAPIEKMPPLPHIPKRLCPLREAMLAPSERVLLDAAIGRTVSSLSVGCPPAVPAIVCGEEIDKEAIEILKYYGITECRVMI